jgi:glutamyl-tRNA synthetase
MKEVRTRFAVSPTGYLHVGGVRTALFAWLVARQNQGTFILRIEDTDKAREVAGSEQHIIDSLKWLGLDWDEGPDKGGPDAPYRQSERLAIYKDWAQTLIEQGRAYADPYSPAELEKLRQDAKNQKRPFLFRQHRPDSFLAWDSHQPLRFKSEPKSYKWHDQVMGGLSAGQEAVDDFILIKSDGYPTYNFAHIIDDHLMKVSHVIRSQEFLASVPKYLNLYEALGLELPIFATLPYVIGPDGQKKLSKRDGAKDILDYQREGFLPVALVNFLASLGWNDGSTQEIFSVEELIKKFSLDRVQRSGAKFDEQRLIWLDGAHIRALGTDQLAAYAKPYWPPAADNYDSKYKQQVLSLVQERLKNFGELAGLSEFFFKDLPLDPDLISSNKNLKTLPKDKITELLQKAKAELKDSDFSAADLTQRLNKLLETTKQPPAVLFSLIRIATTHAPASPALAESLAVLGKDTSLRRIDDTLQHI